ncbi:MAG: DUF2059 domain-containing protein [Hyphomicrobiales bacterium]
MDLKTIFYGGLLVLMAIVGGADQLRAQGSQSIETDEITQEHLNLAYEAVFITRASRAYNEIVPNLARRAKAELSEKYPDLENEINRAVDETAIKLAARQGELDLAISRRWAKRFSKSELREISAFYATPAGTKLAKKNTELIASGLDEARKWGAEIGGHLIAEVQLKLKASGHKL